MKNNPGNNPIEPASNEEYADFISQIDIENVWTVKSKVDNRYGPTSPDHAYVDIANLPSWESRDGGFRATIRYIVKMRSTEAKSSTILAQFEVVYAVDFSSMLPMTDQLFVTFGQNNLPLNTWSFLREFLASALGRMNWMIFTLPALKLGAKPPSKTHIIADEPSQEA